MAQENKNKKKGIHKSIRAFEKASIPRQHVGEKWVNLSGRVTIACGPALHNAHVVEEKN
jgi:hypothetical protein